MSKYLKVFLVSVFFILQFKLVLASQQDVSNPYASSSLCSQAVEKYSIEYPDYTRSNCYMGSDNKYYYNICGAGTTCNTSVQNTSSSSTYMNVEDSNAVNNVLSTLSNDNNQNPNAQYFDDATLNKLKIVVEKLEQEKQQKNATEFNNILKALDTKLDIIKTKFPNSVIIGHLVDYLKYETNRLKANTDVDDFFCELTSCNTNTNTNTNTQQIARNIKINTPNNNIQQESNSTTLTTSTSNNGTQQESNSTTLTTSSNNTNSTQTKGFSLSSSHETIMPGDNTLVTVDVNVVGYKCEFRWDSQVNGSGFDTSVIESFKFKRVFNGWAKFYLICPSETKTLNIYSGCSDSGLIDGINVAGKIEHNKILMYDFNGTKRYYKCINGVKSQINMGNTNLGDRCFKIGTYFIQNTIQITDIQKPSVSRMNQLCKETQIRKDDPRYVRGIHYIYVDPNPFAISSGNANAEGVNGDGGWSWTCKEPVMTAGKVDSYGNCK